MFYPLMIDLEQRKLCVIGAGKVALRKTCKFLSYGAQVIVVGEDIREEFLELKEEYKEKLHIIKDNFKEEYLQGVFMAEIATSNSYVNAKVTAMCKERNILCSVADNPKECDYIVPSTVQRGNLILSISTLGNSPSFCAKVRRELEETYTEDIAEFVDLLGQGRELVLKIVQDTEDKKSLLNKMAYMSFQELKQVVNELKGLIGNEDSCRI